jgi:hypothetical protein
MKKCKKCGAPLEGFLYNTIGKLLGLKPSEKDPEMCNKCEADTEVKVEEVKPVVPAAPEAPVEPEVKDDKDELIS